MNRTKLMLLAAAGLVCLGALVACSGKGDETKESATESVTSSTSQTEVETAAPRYDYLEADVLSDVTIEKGDYTNLSLTIPNSLKIKDEDVQEYIQKSICFEKREAVNGTTQVTDKALSLGDDAYIYYKGFVDGEEFSGGSNWDDETPYKLGLGSGAFIPGFEEGLVGVIPNETSKDNPFELHVTFPEDYSEELAGKDAVFHVVVAYAVQYTIPEYNWKFVEEVLLYELQGDFYASDAARLKEFEAYVYDTLLANNETNILNAKIDALWQHLTGTATCKNLPQLEIDFYYDSYVSEIEYYYEYYVVYYGEDLYPTLDSFAAVYLGLGTGEDWKASVREQSEKLVQKDMIGHAIGELEGIESITDEEYEAQIEYWVTHYSGDMTESDVVQSMGETFLRESAYSEKIQEWLLEQVTFTYADGTPLDGESTDEEETSADTSAEIETNADTTADTAAETSEDTAA